MQEKDAPGDYEFHPAINGLQKMVLYKTRTNFYLIGSNVDQSKFRVLKIDRRDPKELNITDDKVFYTQAEIKNLIKMIDEGNKTRPMAGVSGGALRSQSAFGILGFIRFMEGYYMVLITKRRKVGVIGHHSIYTVGDTSIVYIPHESVRQVHEEEDKYVKSFNNIDLTSNFYFSYTYDLTNSLQYNMAPFRNVEPHLQDVVRGSAYMFPSDKEFQGVEDEKTHVAYRNEPCEKFVWNNHLLKDLKLQADPAWVIPVVHGYMQQTVLSIYGIQIQLTFMARRSAKYAGTRFLRRGANVEGDVANEVETEQIVYDYHSDCFSSIVQIRGSIPLHWSQDINKYVAKPPIIMDIRDPEVKTPALHFKKLLSRFGSPIMVFNLVKRREKKSHEKILFKELSTAIDQLNVTLPPDFHIRHVPLDMARINKSKGQSVIGRISSIADRLIKKTGFFCSKGPPYSLHLKADRDYVQLEHTRMDGDKTFGTEQYKHTNRGRLQTGVIRVNCVDCLDRTNTAQYIIGKVALGYQLYSLGVLSKPHIEFDSVCGQLLEGMYEDQGDTLALQYGGSQLVHRIETYREAARWTTQGRDLMQSVHRYYSNTYSDQEKQKSINLFLGVELPGRKTLKSKQLIVVRPFQKSFWWGDVIDGCLPYSAEEVFKVPSFATVVPINHPMIDLNTDFYRTEFSSLKTNYLLTIQNSERDFVPGVRFQSPFVVQKRQQSAPVGKKPPKNNTPNSKETNSISCASSIASSASSSDIDPSDDELVPIESVQLDSKRDSFVGSPLSFADVFPPPEETYGQIYSDLSHRDKKLYQMYTMMAHLDQQDFIVPDSLEALEEELNPASVSSDFEEEPSIRVPSDSLKIYDDSCLLGRNDEIEVDAASRKIYEDYVSFE